MQAKKKTRPQAGGSIKRVVVDFPAPLLTQTESVVAEMGANRSELIRIAVEHYLEFLQKAKLEQALIEGYTSNAAQARAACEEFAFLDSDLS